ncbi:hypothetical protein DNAM5_94 [Haloarcula californiae tailed virus 1]|uniref:Uncharacterized protein n=1 Tax=Haloarcula californiae tailed virus 1 TaxID=1273746 RepID=R4TP04_9CAUD|nr:hypothetical protein M202_gp125 [Haloarcula californiae tailed virus 1]AGM11953.1 hypothetical protein DNAM5_94 [Haloarcula californiae tailed virus 1]
MDIPLLETQMSQKQKQVFDTTDEAVSFLYDNPDFDGELHVREREDLVQDLTDVQEEQSHSPDLPVTEGDVTHRCLFILDRNKARNPSRMLRAKDVLDLSTADSFDAAKALSSLLHAGYVNKRKRGMTAYFYITSTGERVLDLLGDPSDEVVGESVLEF